jgi:hypothetical protein
MTNLSTFHGNLALWWFRTNPEQFRSNATKDEIDDFQRMTDKEIDSDVVPDALLSELESFLQREGLLEE